VQTTLNFFAWKRKGALMLIWFLVGFWLVFERKILVFFLFNKQEEQGQEFPA